MLPSCYRTETISEQFFESKKKLWKGRRKQVRGLGRLSLSIVYIVDNFTFKNHQISTYYWVGFLRGKTLDKIGIETFNINMAKNSKIKTKKLHFSWLQRLGFCNVFPDTDDTPQHPDQSPEKRFPCRFRETGTIHIAKVFLHFSERDAILNTFN